MGKKINTTIMNVLVPKFECLMQEGGIYMISNFEVKGNSGVIRLANHPSKIYFHEDTLVRNCTDYTCSVDVFNFVSFKKVLDQTIDKSLAFDVVSQVISNKDIMVTQNNHKFQIACLAPKYTPVISSFRKSLQQKKDDGSMLETKIQLSDKTIYTNPADYFTNFSLKNINELIDIQKSTGCIVIATIIKIKTEQDLPQDPVVEKNIALAKIELLLLASGTSLKTIPNMPYPDYKDIKQAGNVMVQEKLNYDVKQMKNDHDNLYRIMTHEQKGVYNNLMNAVDKNQGGVFFLYGYGGTGKTFIRKTLCAGIMSKRDIVISVASSGIAALLLTRGRTAHSRFKIPINPNEKSFYSITPDSDLASLLKKAKLIVWDEAPMMHKHCFEALERTLRDILRSTKPFAGKVIVFGGDFRQILLVVQKGSRHDIVNATINHSHIWDHCTVLNLTVNMRLKFNSTNEEDAETKRFADWILDIGEGNVGGPNDGEAEVEFPKDVLIK